MRDGATTTPMLAREVSGLAKAELWEIADAAWPDFPGYRASTDREVPILALRTSSAAEALDPEQAQDAGGLELAPPDESTARGGLSLSAIRPENPLLRSGRELSAGCGK